MTHHSNQMKLFKSIAAAAVAVVTSGGIIGFAPTADAGQMKELRGMARVFDGYLRDNQGALCVAID